MDLPKLRMPNLNVEGLRSGDKFNMLAEYLLSLEKNLRFVLSNLEEDNFSDSMMNMLNAANSLSDTNYAETLEQAVRRSEIKNLVLQNVFPVGSIYASTSDAQPSEVLGGTWEQLEETQAGVILWKRTA